MCSVSSESSVHRVSGGCNVNSESSVNSVNSVNSVLSNLGRRASPNITVVDIFQRGGASNPSFKNCCKFLKAFGHM